MQDELLQIMSTYGNMLFQYAFLMLGNRQDAEDVLQDTLIKYWKKAPVFRNPDHEKAWLLTVVANQCRDMLRFRKRHLMIDLESIQELSDKTSEEVLNSGILEALMRLPEKYKQVLYLHYVEEYSVADIANIIGRTSSAVKMRLKKGRQLLEEKYRKEFM